MNVLFSLFVALCTTIVYAQEELGSITLELEIYDMWETYARASDGEKSYRIHGVGGTAEVPDVTKTGILLNFDTGDMEADLRREIEAPFVLGGNVEGRSEQALLEERSGSFFLTLQYGEYEASLADGTWEGYLAGERVGFNFSQDELDRMGADFGAYLLPEDDSVNPVFGASISVEMPRGAAVWADGGELEFFIPHLHIWFTLTL